MPDLYEILGVARDADTATIKRVHRKLAKQHHPDRGGDEERFKAIQQAYDVLSNPAKRARYDKTGEIPENEDAKAFEQAMFLFDGVVATIPDHQLDRTDIVKEILKEADRAKARGEKAIEEEGLKKRRINRVIARLRRKDGAPSTIVGVLTDRIAGIDKTITQMKQGLEDIERARVFILEHEYEVAGLDPLLPGPFHTFLNTTRTS